MLNPETQISLERSPHVLLADDDDEFSALLEHVLGHRGYRVTRVADGAALRRALATSSRNDDDQRFDVVLTDAYMPKINGLDALRTIPSERLPPVVLMTASRDPETRETAYELGVKLVIDKPFDLLDFCTVVECLVGRPPPRFFK